MRCLSVKCWLCSRCCPSGSDKESWWCFHSRCQQLESAGSRGVKADQDRCCRGCCAAPFSRLFLHCSSRFTFHWYFLCLWFQDIDINTDDELDAYIEDLITKGDWAAPVQVLEKCRGAGCCDGRCRFLQWRTTAADEERGFLDSTYVVLVYNLFLWLYMKKTFVLLAGKFLTL